MRIGKTSAGISLMAGGLMAGVLTMGLGITPAMAHPGALAQGGFLSAFVHPFSGVDHVLAMVAVGVLGVLAGGAALWRLPAAFVTSAALAMTSAAFLPLAGVPLEALIAISVVVLGVLVMRGGGLRLGLLLPLVAAFGAVHGAVHGLELKTAVVSTAVGFVAGTVALHALGITLGLTARSISPALVRAGGAVTAAVGVALLVGF